MLIIRFFSAHGTLCRPRCDASSACSRAHQAASMFCKQIEELAIEGSAWSAGMADTEPFWNTKIWIVFFFACLFLCLLFSFLKTEQYVLMSFLFFNFCSCFPSRTMFCVSSLFPLLFYFLCFPLFSFHSSTSYLPRILFCIISVRQIVYPFPPFLLFPLGPFTFFPCLSLLTGPPYHQQHVKNCNSRKGWS